MVKEHDFRSCFMRQTFSYLLKIFLIFENRNYKGANVFHSPDITLFVFHFISHRVADLLETRNQLNYLWAICVNVESRWRHCDMRFSCSTYVISDLSLPIALNLLYLRRVQISWCKSELCFCFIRDLSFF